MALYGRLRVPSNEADVEAGGSPPWSGTAGDGPPWSGTAGGGPPWSGTAGGGPPWSGKVRNLAGGVGRLGGARPPSAVSGTVGVCTTVLWGVGETTWMATPEVWIPGQSGRETTAEPAGEGGRGTENKKKKPSHTNHDSAACWGRHVPPPPGTAAGPIVAGYPFVSCPCHTIALMSGM